MDPRIDDILRSQLDHTLDASDFPELGDKYEGKVRDNYTRGDQRAIVVTDRISAFDVVLGTIPCKGQVLNQLATHWFEVTAAIAKNHMIAAPDPNVMIVRELVPLKAEFVMRAYLTGSSETSIWRAYERGDRTFCGHALAEGMTRHQELPGGPILTPSTKADKGEHDVSVSREELLGMGVITEDHFDRAAQVARELFAFGQKEVAARGLILVDTKYEMGVDENDEIVVIDEIHTPDSSRYWYADDYEERMAAGENPRSLDKEFVRRHLAEEHGYRGDGPPPPLSDDVRVEAAKRYIEIFEQITGRAFEPATGDPAARMKKNLAPYLGEA